MDEIAQYNRERWDALVEANALFTRPYLGLTVESARAYLDPENRLGSLEGKSVLCLAGGGGQQSVAFALLGANVTVLDLSDGQLQRDREAAARYQLTINTVQGDMRDLSALPAASFGVVWHPYSLNFVPDARAVFAQVARVIKPGGIYHFMAANPFVCGMGGRDWNGQAYEVHRAYVDGAAIEYDDEQWVYRDGQPYPRVARPREYRQTLGRLINGLVENGFVITGLHEESIAEQNPEPGTWAHFVSVAPPWFTFWTVYRPDFLPAIAQAQSPAR